MEQLQILLADDHPVIRRSIRSLLESHAGWAVCAEVSNGWEAVEETARLHPDVILVDLSMPELNGLAATRAILQRDPEACVLVLTLYESEEVAAEVARTGAKGVVTKLNAHETLIPKIESLLAGAVHLAGSVIDSVRHIAALFRSRRERYHVLAPFVQEGLTRGERTVHVIDPPDRKTHLHCFRREGVDLARAEAAGMARLISWEETYLRDDHFDQEAMLETIQQLIRESSSGRVDRTRFIAHMEWALLDHAGVDDLIEYESRLNDVLPAFPDVVICAYDLTKFKSETIVDVIRTHPAVLMGDVLRDNPFYRPRSEWGARSH
jgi:DNA-binding NarL/FixJ family response regulator